MRHIAIVGLGYVGLSLAMALRKHFPVIGYDISANRIDQLRDYYDCNQLISREDLAQSNIEFVETIEQIKQADFYIITVSTPAYYYELPNLKPLLSATTDLATVLKKGDIIVYESTVYPGTTEEVCLPILEKHSQLRSGKDFFLGYSPERISPNDTTHTLKNVPKIVAAQNQEVLAIIQSVYSVCCDTVYPVSTIKTAEAVKILENTQRDINIAFINEFATIMHAMDINMPEILQAAGTKWSFNTYKPGFVGGHCIAIDPLYLAFKAKRLGVNHDLILTARKINDNMTHFVIQELISLLIKNNIVTQPCRIGIFGITYKENIPDVRNSLALKFIKELQQDGFECLVHDPLADKELINEKYALELTSFAAIRDIAVAIILVGHNFYRQTGLMKISEKMAKPIIMDVPNLFTNDVAKFPGISYWSL